MPNDGRFTKGFTPWNKGTVGLMATPYINPLSKILRDNNLTTTKQALKCEELWDRNNGVTLCEDCHNLTKKGRNYGKQ